MEKMKEKAREIKGLKKKISTKAKQVGLKANLTEKETKMFKVFQKIYYSKVKEVLGLDQCQAFFSGAAPLTKETAQYFLSLDIKIMELTGVNPLEIRRQLDAERERFVARYNAETDLVKKRNMPVSWMQDGEMITKRYVDMTGQDWENWYTARIMSYGFSEAAATMSPPDSKPALGGGGATNAPALSAPDKDGNVPGYEGPTREEVAEDYPDIGTNKELWIQYQNELMGK